ncbi:major capsid protein [Rhodococcus phage Peregrin]|nr:major capsid protein [Rhodococcus phage Peregrin]
MSNMNIEKVIETSTVGSEPGDGFLKIEQANQFIDHMFDASVLWKEAEKRKMNASYAEWPTARVGAKLVRKATEGTDTGINAGASFTKVSITTTKLRLDWEVTTESLEDNIEGEDLDTHLVKLFSGALANDIEDISQNGDVTLLPTDATLGAFDGWHKKAIAGGHVRNHVSGDGAQLGRSHFNKAINALPRKYKQNKGALRFYGSSNLVQNYLYSQSDTNVIPSEYVYGENHLRQFQSPEGAAGYESRVRPFGVPLVEVPMFDTEFNELNAGTGNDAHDSTSYLELTYAKNRIIGVQRDIQVYREFVKKKDTIEYTVYTRVGVAWQDLDAVVTVTGIPVLD